MLHFQRVDATDQWWRETAQFPDRMVFHTPEWIAFLAESQQAKPIFADIYEANTKVGSFCSLQFRRFGIPILASPFPGWGTMYMGFTLEPEVPRWMAVEAVVQFALHEVGCLHFEIADRLLTPADGKYGGMDERLYWTYESDLRRSEEELFKRMESNVRQSIRKANKSGVVIEEALGDETFVLEYYDQLKDVFAKQGLVPTYGVSLVRQLVNHMHPTGNLLLLRARDPDGKCIATGIYPGLGSVAHFWGNASYRPGQHLRPNQLMHWYAMRYWRERGVQFFDWGGEGDYKARYGCQKKAVPRFCISKVPMLPALRDQAQTAFRLQLRVRGWLHRHSQFWSSQDAA